MALVQNAIQRWHMSLTAIVLLLAVAIGSSIFSLTLSRKNTELAQPMPLSKLRPSGLPLKRRSLRARRSGSRHHSIAAERSPGEYQGHARSAEIASAHSGDCPFATGEKLPDLPAAVDDQRELNQLALQQLMLTLEFELGHPERAVPYIEKALTIAKSAYSSSVKDRTRLALTWWSSCNRLPNVTSQRIAIWPRQKRIAMRP